MAATSHVLMTSAAGSAKLRVLLQAALSVLGASAILSKAGFARRFSARLVVLGVRAMTPLACLLVLRNTPIFFRWTTSWSARRLLWYTASVWASAEFLFLVYIQDYWRRLDIPATRRWTAILDHSTEEKRKASFLRYLLMIAQVSRGGSDSSSTDAAALVALTNKRSKDSGMSRVGSGALARSSGSSSSRIGLPIMKTPSWSGGTGLLSKVGSLGSFSPSQSRREASTDNLLELMCHSGNSPHAPSEALSEEEFRRLKILEIAGWFHGPDADAEAHNPEAWLRRGNIEDWVAHYWFRGVTPEALDMQPGASEELGNLVDLVLDFTGLVLEEGRNPSIRPRLLMSDPLPVLHRPLLVYVGSSLICPFTTYQVMRYLGFRRERVGGLCYWHRGVREGVRSDSDLAGPRQIPVVFLHGLGVGLVPYYLFIHRLSERCSGAIFVPELPFLAMMPWERVPSAREIVAQLQDMLAVHRFPGAHFVGHSFGTIILGWMMKMSRSSIICSTFMEPCCILALKSDQWSKAMWEPPKTVMYQLLRYFVFRELFTVNLLCRCCFWEQSVLWPEDILTPAVIELASDDAVVSSLFTRRLLEHERTARKQRRRTTSLQRRGLAERRPMKNMMAAGSSQDVQTYGLQTNEDMPLDIQWTEGFIHGQILFHRKQTLKLFSKMRQMVQDIHAVHD